MKWILIVAAFMPSGEGAVGTHSYDTVAECNEARFAMISYLKQKDPRMLVTAKCVDSLDLI